jgi:hypothetical protein
VQLQVCVDESTVFFRTRSLAQGRADPPSRGAGRAHELSVNSGYIGLLHLFSNSRMALIVQTVARYSICSDPHFPLAPLHQSVDDPLVRIISRGLTLGLPPLLKLIPRPARNLRAESESRVYTFHMLYHQLPFKFL